MDTLAWLLIFGGAVIIRFVSKGRGITDIPGDIGDILTGILTNDPKAIRGVLARGDSSLAQPLSFASVSTGVNVGANLGTAPSQYDLGKVDPQLIPIANEIGTRYKIKTITGYRNNPALYGNADHKSGKSIDVFIPDKATGDAIAHDLTTNPAHYNVKYVIWYQRIWYPGSGWRTMPDRGSDNNNHKNHVHLTIN